MRPDTRSFSFTWLRGAQHQQELSLGRATTRSQSLSRNSGYGIIPVDRASPDLIQGQRKALPRQCTGGGQKLRRLGSSFLQNITHGNKTNGGDIKYDFIVEDEPLEGEADEDTQDSEDINCPSSKPNTRSISKRLNKTVQDVKSTLENMSQKFRRSTARRYRMKAESPSTPATATKRILGRTPTKLYSPFGFDTPQQKTPKRLGTDRGSTPRLATTSMSRSNMNSTEDTAVKDIRKGLTKFQFISRGMTRRSVRF